MSVSAVSSAIATALQQSHLAPPPPPKPASATLLPQDTVSLSSTAQKAPQTGDVDHDGDSH